MKKTLFLSCVIGLGILANPALAETKTIAAGETVTYSTNDFSAYDAIDLSGTLNTNNIAIPQAITTHEGAVLNSSVASWGNGNKLTGILTLEGATSITGKGLNFGGTVNLNNQTLTIKSMTDAGVYFREGSSLTGTGTISVESRTLQFRDSSINNANATLNIAGGTVEIRSANETTLAGVTGTSGTLKTGDIAASTLNLAGNGTYSFGGTVQNDNNSRVLTINYTGEGTQTFSGTVASGILNGQADHKDRLRIGTVTGGTITNATITGRVSGGSISGSVLSGEIAGGTITDSVYNNNNITGGTFNNVTISHNERVNIHNGTATFGDVTMNITQSTGGYAVVLRDSGNLNITGTANFTTTNHNKVAVADGCTLTIKEGGNMTAAAVYQSENGLYGTVNVEAGGTLNTNGKVNVKTLTNAGTVSVDTLNTNTLTNSGQLTAASLGALSGKTSVTNTAGTLTVTGTANISELNVTGGQVVLAQASEGINLTNVTLQADTALTLGSDESHNFTLSAERLTSTGAATINANVDLTNTSSLALNGIITLGCDLELGDGGVELSGSLLEGLLAGTSESITLFTSVDGATINHQTFTGQVAANNVFSNQTLADYYVAYSDGNIMLTKSTSPTPEPTTGTLSLLALAGLCARRRRK